MIQLKINNIAVEVAEGSTVMDAARLAGFEIPTMCNGGDVEHFASCMVCVVKDARNGALLPACSAMALPNQDIITQDDEIEQARKMSVELLMSEHVGDCEAPCRMACPAQMDIPSMNRLIAQHAFDEALEVVRRDIALPGVMGRICPAPCEGVCRRKEVDEAVSICLLKRFASDAAAPFQPKIAAENGFKVGIVGAGPAGLSAAYFLRLKGMTVEVFDIQAAAGGALRYQLPENRLDRGVLDAEVAIIADMGVRFHFNREMDLNDPVSLLNGFDAVVIATGKLMEKPSSDRIFIIGGALRSSKMAIRAAAQGKEVAVSIEQLRLGLPVKGVHKRFNSTIGKIYADEHAAYMLMANDIARKEPLASTGEVFAPGFVAADAVAEASRCMDCDCRKADNCLLREHADRLNIAKRRFNYSERVRVNRIMGAEKVVYEPGKCIKCGICVRITAKHRETFGFTFIGRGFDVVIGAPYDESLSLALTETAELVVASCPTGALSMKKCKR